MRRITITLSIIAMAQWSIPLLAAEEGGKQLPHNHVALIAGLAFEEKADGGRQNGNMLGFDYVRQPYEHWGFGVGFEVEVFGNSTKRHGVLAFPVSYYPGNSWKVFAAPGVEFRDQGEPDKALIRFGTGYDFELGHHFTLSPVAQVDFIAGGTNVYVLSLVFGYGF